MKLRLLKLEDAPLMLEWMHDDSVVRDLKKDFASKSLEDCFIFIDLAQKTTDNLHLAIIDNKNTYMGTVSLKHITKLFAEFGIVIRKSAMGLGYSRYAMKKILEIGFERYGLQKIFWCVSSNNIRALRFYDKYGYKQVTFPKEAKDFYTVEECKQLVWYEVSANLE